MTTTTTIKITRELLFNGYGRRVPFSWLYRCEGPDGKRYDNRAIGTLRSHLRQRYGRDIQLEEAWDHSVTLRDAAQAAQRG